MATIQDSASLSLYVYSVSIEENRPLLPSGWSLAEPLHVDNIYGFSYGIFRGPGNEVVVAYTGTNEGIDWVSNLGNGLGIGSPQVSAAALVYLQARDAYGDNITLSGHSLGGGLASVISVWFDRPAVVFDHAAFELAARNPLFVQASKVVLAAAGYDLGAFLSYNEVLNFATRELNVQGHHIAGEALEYLRATTPTIGGSQSLSVGEGLGTVDLHSMALFIAAKLSPSFAQATFVSNQILPVVFDKQLYAVNRAASDSRDFLVDLIRSEQADIGNGKLSHFAVDLHRLGQDLTGLNEAAQKALVAQGVEWYYWQGSDYAGQEFFVRNGALLQYTSAQGASLPGAQNKAEVYVQPWLEQVAQSHGVAYSVDWAAKQQWSVASSASTAVVATARNADLSQLGVGNGGADRFTGGQRADVFFGGLGNDTLVGGAGNDTLLGGSDADTLNGGVGNDRLEGASGNDNLSGVDGDDDLQGGGGADILNGGAGSDTLVGGQGVDRYVFSGAFGSDAVVDSDGNGSVWVDGVRLTGGLQLADNMWASDDRQWQYLLQGEDLWIRSAQGVSRSVLLTEWNSMGGNRLDIALSGIEAPLAEQSRVFLGDQRAPFMGNTSDFDWSQVSWAANGVLINGVAAPDFSDVILGSTGADRIEGLGGPDALDGSAGNDLINGGLGGDVLAGGAGSDTIKGGDGNDFISSASSITVGRPSSLLDIWPLSVDPNASDDPRAWGVMGAVNRSDVNSSDWIEAGSGDDLVIAGWGNDYLDGGSYQDTLFGLAGDDVILGGQGPQTLWHGDVLWGDGSADPTAMEYTPEERHGNDFLDGGDGDDVLHGQGGSDVLYGGTGDDSLEGDGEVGFAFHGRDYLDGGDDDDTLHGNGSHDVLLGGAGNDELYGDGDIALEYQGNDYLDGGNDSDKLYGQGKNDTLLGGGGYDELQADYGTTVTINDGDDWLDGGADNDRLWAGGGADSLYGGDGDDHLWGDGEEIPTALDGDDLLDGGAGNDYMWGNGGRDTLLGGLGADWLWSDGEGLSANDQADYLDGGEGNDTLVGGLGDDALWGGAGDDRLSGDGFSNVANNVPTSATDGNDYLNGDEGNDEMVGGGGIDTLLGGAGSDHIWGDGRYDANFGGSDSIEGGAGADYIYAGSGQDTVRGGDGDDGISTDGVDGGDLLFGGDGKDSIQTYADAAHADSGASTVFGGAGDDRIYALGAAHHVYGDEGDDEIYALSASNPADTVAVSIFGGVGNDYVYAVGASHLVDAGEGDDLVYSVEGSLVHVFDFGYGQDTLLIYDYFGTAATPDVIRLGSGVTASDVTLTRLGENETLLSLQATGDSLSIEYLPNAEVGIAASGIGRVEFFDGTVWDAATIESIRNTGKLIVGTEESDLLNGPASNDTLIGGGGNDSLEGGAGSDRLVGGLGDDDYFVDNVGDWVVESASQGHDRVYSSVSHTLRVNVEELVLTGTAAIDGKGNSLHNQLTGNAGNNQLEGLVGADTLKGGAGADTLAGGIGNDRLFGGAGADLYLFNRGDMRDAITENDVSAGVIDQVQFGSGIAVEQVWFTRSGNHLDVSVIGTSDSLRVNNWYLGERYQVEAFSSADGQTLTSDRVDDLVNAMSVYAPPATGQIQLPQSYASLVGIIDAGWI